ncbi:MAG TPA: hypothetical protein VFV99_05950 [Kofleriaceae bacterium]|nr:hypothetical protein [Kofleriaceae bacterium]
MAPRRLLGCLPAAALAVCMWTGCKKDAAPTGLDKRCEQLAKACGDKDKHIEKITGECKQAAQKQTEKTCMDKAIAAYDCYEKELCGGEKVWALDDFRVLADRHKKCTAERDALKECTGK